MQPTESAMRRALRRAEDGVTIDAAEAEVLLAARGADLDRLLGAASAVRDAGLASAGRAGIVTYSRKVFVDVTRLCRDRCHYCTFVKTPTQLAREGKAPYLTPEEVLRIARQGASLGCREVLFTLGDRPEDRWPEAAAWLEEAGYHSTLGYVRSLAVQVLEATGLLPHVNPGVMSWEEIGRLKPVSPSMGMMLETSSRRLFETPGEAHFGSPDKDPAVRLRTIEDAGRLSVPFTTGILVGIGETLAERAESLLDLRRLARQYGHVQEVIVQNFRAKPATAMRAAPDADADEYLAAVAVARVVLGPRMRIQVPPNLSEPAALARLLAAGADDWGGVSPVTPDHVNPERPWPHLDDLERWSADAGFTLTERLTVHPEYVVAGEPWLDPRVAGHVAALADGGTGLADVRALPVGRPWQEPDPTWGSSGRVDLHTEIDTSGRRSDKRADFDDVYGDWALLREQAVHGASSGEGSAAAGYQPGRSAGPAGAAAPQRIDADVAAALAVAADDPRRLTDANALALVHCDGPALAALAGIADDVRRDVVGNDVTYVVNRNINFTNVCYTGCRFCAFAQRRKDLDAFTLSLVEVADRAEEAWKLGASEVCMQGGIDPELPATAYFDLARAVKERVPGMHVHAFSPMEVVNGASRTGMSVREWLTEAKAAGVGSLPGTAAEILDDDVRWLLTKGKLPTTTWVEVVSTAHAVGLPTSSTMMYGHVDTPAHWVAHLRTLAGIQERSLAGGGAAFTEFVALPFVHHSAPIYLAGVARPGPTMRDNVAVHALARLLLHGLVDNIQTSWVKLGPDGTRAMLRSGSNDVGGTLMEETISRMAGSQHGSAMTVRELEELASSIGRTPRCRTTTYGDVIDRSDDVTTVAS
ncbi:bifunctional FO biosynthesis protein CofGH [Kineosporia sp. A_224]|uniref:bifunctional FO biosynthesis protein CofGH n=1 Tax=Kineosporia sp. A_224 TaxID=1962180 RepID=UPI000B4A6EE4|nr:bifunctional FO biosynthesis protein CofGH [Kineosporia sp. A_224]